MLSCTSINKVKVQSSKKKAAQSSLEEGTQRRNAHEEKVADICVIVEPQTLTYYMAVSPLGAHAQSLGLELSIIKVSHICTVHSSVQVHCGNITKFENGYFCIVPVK